MDTRLGEYLRARRELLRPQDVGLPEQGRRRVPGLRREELAMLAGISSDYYLRLEQGRDQNPSEQVLESIARALQLDQEATAHLHALARPHVRKKPARKVEKASEGIRQLVMSWTDTPAYVQSRLHDVLVANPMATALCPSYREGVNMLREAFLNPAVRAMYRRDWDAILAGTVAGLRALVGPDVDDPALAELVGELSVRSEEFRRLWARHDVRRRTSGVSYLMHPMVGELDLRHEKLAVTGADGQILVVYHAEPDSRSAQALSLLRAL
ncbi:helix-turn-helix transcriptional regulator [Kutzneria kofuensis]|uniref:Transcriptional regulator with XRE-family HTH domain n=1 Tax=Kutzneria kofuensis TaxID=103725 RepID=A0A7W9KRS8_9PSEU|nr:helix-turn-helix transcriptional regulator [Kutzneria kofuensis]MBB5897571.1 transcriptional regulator with XRE-family HTH domain [Kutzneria kofuensis]